MSIKFAILGILSWKPATGYDIKKIIEESSVMYWSGNNNQIYKSLVQLLDEGFVTNEVQHQESSPSKKVYTITDEGLAELKEWVLSSPELPELKKSFLNQLAWADQLNTDELNDLLSRYENEISMQVLLEQEKKRRGMFAPDRTLREAYLWEMIHENIISSYKNEWLWIQKIRKELCTNNISKERNRMNYKIIENNNKKYIECISSETLLCTEQHALDLITACIEHNTNLLMLHAEVLSEDFFKLRTGLAGNFLQKLMNYHVKTAAIMTDELTNKGKFKDMVIESNKGNHFRVFDSITEAETWLVN